MNIISYMENKGIISLSEFSIYSVSQAFLGGYISRFDLSLITWDICINNIILT